MTEAGVLNILLKNEETKGYHFDYPKQQSETVKVVARNLTDIIYESYKRKSCASTSKRYQVLVGFKLSIQKLLLGIPCIFL